MRQPKVENKYNLKHRDIPNLVILDRSRICKPLFWRNNVINAWCISGSVGSDADRKYGNDNEYWIGIYDKPYHGKMIRCYCNCWGGMGTYSFKEFFNMKEIENERDLQTQEKLLEIINELIDEGILGVKCIHTK